MLQGNPRAERFSRDLLLLDDLDPDKPLELRIRVEGKEVGVPTGMQAICLAHGDGLAQCRDGLLDLPTSSIRGGQGVNGMIGARIELERFLEVGDGRSDMPSIQLDDPTIIESLGRSRHGTRRLQLLLADGQISAGARQNFSLRGEALDHSLKSLARPLELLAIEEPDGLFERTHSRRGWGPFQDYDR